ncbi:MAG: hypothetical protein QME92_00055 [Bacillota bacterium]|nr:hypothetical protein [Bacillota bacterium]
MRRTAKVDPAALEPPAHLSERSKALWRQVVPDRAKSPGRLALLQTALEALDRADQARQVLDREGLFTTTPGSGVTHVHPAARIEREARALFLRAWTELGLEWDAVVDGRPD